MARTKGKKNLTPRNNLTNSPHPPDVIYNNLEPIDKLVVYYYWLYIRTDGKQGQNPEKSGFREHWNILLVVRSHWSAGAFYTRGKVSISIRMAMASF